MITKQTMVACLPFPKVASDRLLKSIESSLGSFKKEASGVFRGKCQNEIVWLIDKNLSTELIPGGVTKDYLLFCEDSNINTMHILYCSNDYKPDYSKVTPEKQKQADLPEVIVSIELKQGSKNDK